MAKDQHHAKRRLARPHAAKQVSALAMPDLVIEIEAWAICDD